MIRLGKRGHCHSVCLHFRDGLGCHLLVGSWPVVIIGVVLPTPGWRMDQREGVRMAHSESTELRREVARLVRKIACVLGAGPEQTALLVWAEQVEDTVSTGNTVEPRGRRKRGAGTVPTRLHL